MKQGEEAMLRALLVRSKHPNELIRFLPARYAEKLKTEKEPASLDFSSLFSTTNWLEQIHYSWIYDPLTQIPDASKPLFAAILSSSQLKGLESLLHEKIKEKHLCRFATAFLAICFKKMVYEDEIVEPALLPASKMNTLLRIKKAVLLHLIDLLGIYDLAHELRQIVDKELLGKIYAALSQQQLHFLHYASKQTTKWMAPKLKLTGWDGSPSYLNKLLHQRGLIRLALAIFDEDRSFCWHLIHHLDTGRAGVILKTMRQKQDPELTRYFKGQLLHLLKRYQ